MIGVAFAAMLAGMSQASDNELYLTCKVTKSHTVAIADVYRVPPRDGMAMAKDVLEGGVVSLMEPPPETWVVDRSQRSIKAGPGSWHWTFSNASFGANEISGSLRTGGGSLIWVSINRITGNVETTYFVTDAQNADWQKKHGKPLPPSWTWTQRCAASQATKF